MLCIGMDDGVVYLITMLCIVYGALLHVWNITIQGSRHVGRPFSLMPMLNHCAQWESPIMYISYMAMWPFTLRALQAYIYIAI